jgi:Chaperone of endosialidase
VQWNCKVVYMYDALTSDGSVGGVVATSSGSNVAVAASNYFAFDGVASTAWGSKAATYNVGTGVAVGPGSTTNIVNNSPTTVSGEWIDIGGLDVARGVLTGYSVVSTGAGAPRDWMLVGSSNNGTTWYKIDSRSGETDWTTLSDKRYSVSSPSAFSNLRLIVTGTNGGLGYTTINNLGYYNVASRGDPALLKWDSNAYMSSVQDGLYMSFKNKNVGVGIETPLSKLHVAGDMRLTGNLLQSSDIALKEDLVVIDNAIDRVMQINGYSYKMKADKGLGKRSAGLIAQEVIAVLPEVVEVIDAEGHMGVTYGNVVALLVEAIKEMQVEIDVLKKTVGAVAK